nr:MAG TPA: hypothetical protein [Caudoviricetes sp.]
MKSLSLFSEIRSLVGLENYERRCFLPIFRIRQIMDCIIKSIVSVCISPCSSRVIVDCKRKPISSHLSLPKKLQC